MRRLGEDVVDDSAVSLSEAEIAAGVAVGEALVAFTKLNSLSSLTIGTTVCRAESAGNSG
jgi:hypothetical protein